MQLVGGQRQGSGGRRPAPHRRRSSRPRGRDRRHRPRRRPGHRATTRELIRELCRAGPLPRGRRHPRRRTRPAPGSMRARPGDPGHGRRARRCCSSCPRERVIAALDACDGEVVVEGWRKRTGRDVLDRIGELRDLCRRLPGDLRRARGPPAGHRPRSRRSSVVAGGRQGPRSPWPAA